MTRHLFRFTVIVALAAGLTACSKQNETDQKLAELQKQLDETKQELAAKSAEAGTAAAAAGTAASGAAQTAADAQTTATAAAQTAAAAASQSDENRKAAEAANAQAGRDRAATEKALVDQQAAAARQAEENDKLRREMEAMKPREFTLKAGTVIPARTTAEVSTSTMKNGSVFDALLEKDLVVDGTTLAKAGSKVTCIVVTSDPGGRVKGVASMTVAARSIAGVSGTNFNVSTDSYSVDAKSTKGRDVKRTGIATGAGAVIGAIAGGGKGAAIGAGVGAATGVGVNAATRGDAAVIPTETLIEFTLSAPATVVVRPSASR
jgi:hypothetical protein